jgi:hypothetical protein
MKRDGDCVIAVVQESISEPSQREPSGCQENPRSEIARKQMRKMGMRNEGRELSTSFSYTGRLESCEVKSSTVSDAAARRTVPLSSGSVIGIQGSIATRRKRGEHTDQSGT